MSIQSKEPRNTHPKRCAYQVHYHKKLLCKAKQNNQQPQRITSQFHLASQDARVHYTVPKQQPHHTHHPHHTNPKEVDEPVRSLGHARETKNNKTNHTKPPQKEPDTTGPVISGPNSVPKDHPPTKHASVPTPKRSVLKNMPDT